jgi:hypothetical protein
VALCAASPRRKYHGGEKGATVGRGGFYSDTVGWGTSRGAAPRGDEGRGASTVVRRRGVAGSGSDMALAGSTRASGARPAVKQGRAGADRWAPATVPGSGGLNIIQIQMNSNYFKTFQTLTDPKTAFPSLKILK